MRILLINPSSHFRKMIPSVGLVYIGTILKKNGYKLKIVDSSFTLEDPLIIIADYKPEIVGISCNVSNYSNAMQIAKFAKQMGSIVVVGGPHASLTYHKILKNKYVDYCIAGEGEHSFLFLVKKLERNEKIDNIPGLIYRNKEKIIKNKPKLINDLDSLPYPDYFLAGINRINTYPISTSRGCPYNCIYCCAPKISGNRWRARTPENVIKELLQAKKKYKLTNFVILDDNFPFDKERAKKFCRMLISENIDLTWHCLTGMRADYLDKELLTLMKMSGCKVIAIGIESADLKVFSRIKKGESLKKIKEVIKMCKKLNINIHGFFIVGLPFSTIQSENKSLQFVKKMGLDSATWSLAAPFPGTKLHRLVIEKCKIIHEPENHQISYSLNLEPFFEMENFKRDDIKKCYIINNLRCSNYFIMSNNFFYSLFRFILLLFFIFKYDFINLPFYFFDIPRTSLHKFKYLKKIY